MCVCACVQQRERGVENAVQGMTQRQHEITQNRPRATEMAAENDSYSTICGRYSNCCWRLGSFQH